MNINNKNINKFSCIDSPHIFYAKLKSYLQQVQYPESLLRNEKPILRRLMFQLNKREKHPYETISHSKQLSEILNILSWKISKLETKYGASFFAQYKHFFTYLSKRNIVLKKFDYGIANKSEIKKKNLNFKIKRLGKEQGKIIRTKKCSEKWLLYQKGISQLTQRKIPSYSLDLQEKINIQINSITNSGLKLSMKNCLNCSEYFKENSSIGQDNYHNLIFFENFWKKQNKIDMVQKIRDVVIAICALSNEGDGIIFIGVKDKKIEGIDYDVNKFELLADQIQKSSQKILRCGDQNCYKISTVPVHSEISDDDTKITPNNKVVIRIKVYSSGNNLNYVEFSKQNMPSEYLFCIKNQGKNTFESIVYYQKEDIYKFITKKFYKSKERAVHYGIKCNQIMHQQQQNSLKIDNQIQDDNIKQEDQNDKEQQEDQNIVFQKNMNHSIIILKGDKVGNEENIKQNKFDQRYQKVCEFFSHAFPQSKIQIVYEKKQKEGGFLGSRIYMISHAKSSGRLKNQLKKNKQLHFVKICQISRMILITSEKNKLNERIHKGIIQRSKGSQFKYGQCEVTNISKKDGVEKHYITKREYILLNHTLIALSTLIYLYSEDFKCLFYPQKDKINFVTENQSKDSFEKK